MNRRKNGQRKGNDKVKQGLSYTPGSTLQSCEVLRQGFPIKKKHILKTCNNHRITNKTIKACKDLKTLEQFSLHTPLADGDASVNKSWAVDHYFIVLDGIESKRVHRWRRSVIVTGYCGEALPLLARHLRSFFFTPRWKTEQLAFAHSSIRSSDLFFQLHIDSSLPSAFLSLVLFFWGEGGGAKETSYKLH